ncbi:PxKF domain-containing protein [Candidatus Culexarchaeum yellowstonense]|uniref:PxKF domain-containing protein n=1 Tax=Candidatus Culexarchaeum yellowstonense TaxID=2928963 RepID=UPI0026ECB204|nr:PxKF domain-containing protein [Candidatus Culexarchaeum yellowstonense]
MKRGSVSRYQAMLLIGVLISFLSIIQVPPIYAGNPQGTPPTLPAPTGLTATVNPNNSITLTWNPVENATMYQGQWGTDQDFKTYSKFEVDASTTSYTTQANLQPGRTYYFRVRAAIVRAGRSTQFSDWSVVSVTISPTIEPLSITAPPDIIVEGNTTGGAIVVDLGTPTVSGGTPPYTITNNATSFFPLGETIVTWTATDASGNTATATQKVTVVDTTPPTIEAPDTLTVLVNAPKSVLNGRATATDIVDPNPTLTNDAPDFFPLGTTIVTWTATDASGNTATKKTIVTAIYSFSGFLPPLGPGPTQFKTGSTIPVKFQLTDYSGNYISTAVAQIWVVSLTNPGTSSGSSNNGNYFRYDPTNNQYIFNLSTKGMSPGTYKIFVTLDDGTTYSISITLK